MVRTLFLALFLTLSLNAGEVIEAVKNILGNRYYRSQKIVNVLFRNENRFYKGSRLDIAKIVSKLKANGLLNLYFKTPREMEISFAAEGNPLLFLKIINESLHNIGYSFFTTKEAKREGDYFHWKIVLKSESAMDPELFAKELERRGVFIRKIRQRSLTRWDYDLDIFNAEVLAKSLNSYNTINLKKPLDDYWLNIKVPASFIEISAHPNDTWHPNVVFYDSSLQILGYYSKKDRDKRVKLQIPPDAKYIKISDYYSLSNIKRGLKIRLFQ